GYRTDLAFGEDHARVWAARFNGIPVYACHVKLATSAAKYHQHGWGVSKNVVAAGLFPDL
ncbi:MAG: hypothetical protein ACI86X_000802, partial [Moritella sp.]